MTALFDTHAHYDDEQFDRDRDELLESLPDAGVGLVLNPGCDEESSRKALALAESHPHVYAAVGWHPENCGPFQPSDIAALRRLAGHPKAVAIGEIGLDYHWEENPPKEKQQKVLRLQLALARELNLPVIIHDRDAHADCLSIIDEFPGLYGVFHCYSGSLEMARELLRRGWYLGFDGPVTYKNARKNLAVAKECPADRLLLETDAPYLAPIPMRGIRNDSRYLVYVAARLAEVRGVTKDQLIAQSAENGKRLFGIR